MLSLPFSQNCFKPKWIWRRVGRTTSAPTTFVFEHNISSHGPGADRPRAFGLPRAHWKLTRGSGFAATLAGECHLRNVRQGWAADRKSEIAEGFRFLRLALSIDGNATLALSMLGRATASFSGDFDTAREMVDRAVALNPNSFRAWEERGWTYLVAGQPEEAIRSFERRIRLSPFDPLLFATFTGMSIAFIGLRRFDEAVSAARKAVSQNPLFPFTYAALRRPWLI